MMEDDFRNTLYQEYVTTCLSSLMKIKTADHGIEWDLPTYYEMIYPKVTENPEKSGTEIVNDLITRLTQ